VAATDSKRSRAHWQGDPAADESHPTSPSGSPPSASRTPRRTAASIASGRPTVSRGSWCRSARTAEPPRYLGRVPVACRRDLVDRPPRGSCQMRLESHERVQVPMGPDVGLVRGSGHAHAGLIEAEPCVRPGSALRRRGDDPDRWGADVAGTLRADRSPQRASTSVRTSAASRVPSRLSTWSSIGAWLSASRLRSAAAARATAGSSSDPVTSTMRRSYSFSWSQGGVPLSTGERFDHAEPRYPTGARLVASITVLMSPWARQAGL
jgi:hypothetical protein